MDAEHPDTLDIHTKLAHWTEQGKPVRPDGRPWQRGSSLTCGFETRNAAQWHSFITPPSILPHSHPTAIYRCSLMCSWRVTR